MFDYWRQSLARKKARRITQEYPTRIDTFQLPRDGEIQFANWENPLVKPVELTQTEIDFFRKFIKPGDTVIDIGTNIGDTTVPMGIAAGAEGLTLGFDPNPYVFKVMEKNAALNKTRTNIVALPFAISVEEEEFYFISSEASFANGGISPTQESRHGKFVYGGKVKGVNLNRYLHENFYDRLSRLSFIKIDTEGYDKEIIKSISDLLRNHKPALVAESFGDSPASAKEELFNVISSLGYDVYKFDTFTADTRTAQITRADQMPSWKHTINIFALPRD